MKRLTKMDIVRWSKGKKIYHIVMKAYDDHVNDRGRCCCSWFSMSYEKERIEYDGTQRLCLTCIQDGIKMGQLDVIEKE